MKLIQSEDGEALNTSILFFLYVTVQNILNCLGYCEEWTVHATHCEKLIFVVHFQWTDDYLFCGGKFLHRSDEIRFRFDFWLHSDSCRHHSHPTKSRSSGNKNTRHKHEHMRILLIFFHRCKVLTVRHLCCLIEFIPFDASKMFHLSHLSSIGLPRRLYFENKKETTTKTKGKLFDLSACPMQMQLHDLWAFH